MSDKVFLDTNVLVYAFDHDAGGPKTERSKELIEEGLREGRGSLSTQILQEFYVAVTRKIGRTMKSEQPKKALKDLAKIELVTVDYSVIERGVDLHQDYPLSFWDGL